jgi:hypothetical protein
MNRAASAEGDAAWSQKREGLSRLAVVGGVALAPATPAYTTHALEMCPGVCGSATCVIYVDAPDDSAAENTEAGARTIRSRFLGADCPGRCDPGTGIG